MTKPREKTREELTAEIEDGKKKIRQFENREKMLRQKLDQMPLESTIAASTGSSMTPSQALCCTKSGSAPPLP